jgi:hypothetical protein
MVNSVAGRDDPECAGHRESCDSVFPAITVETTRGCAALRQGRRTTLHPRVTTLARCLAGVCAALEPVCIARAVKEGVQGVQTTISPTDHVVAMQQAAAFVRFVVNGPLGGAINSLRADFLSEVVVLFLLPNAGVVRAMRLPGPDAWTSLIGSILDDLRRECAHPSARHRVRPRPTRRCSQTAVPGTMRLDVRWGRIHGH